MKQMDKIAKIIREVRKDKKTMIWAGIQAYCYRRTEAKAYRKGFNDGIKFNRENTRLKDFANKEKTNNG